MSKHVNETNETKGLGKLSRLSLTKKNINTSDFNEKQSFLSIEKMVCEKCEKKLDKIITPDPWKAGARNTTESGGRKVNENKALTSSRSRFNPIDQTFKPCRICRSKVHQVGSHYCQACSYKKGICAMCGKKLLDTKSYRQSAA